MGVEEQPASRVVPASLCSALAGYGSPSSLPRRILAGTGLPEQSAGSCGGFEERAERARVAVPGLLQLLSDTGGNRKYAFSCKIHFRL